MNAGDDMDPWELAQERLDRRRDPLADPQWTEGLESATRLDLERLARRLSLLERPPRAPLASRLAAAALVLLAPVAVWLVARETSLEQTLESARPGPAVLSVETEAAAPQAERAAPDGVAAEPAPEPPVARVLHYRLVSETRRAGERTLTIRTQKGIEHRHESSRADAQITLAWNQRSFQP